MPEPDTSSADLLKDRQADLALLKDAAIEAGRIALSYFRQDPETWYKENNSPVSVADMEVDGFLSKTLLAARPSYGWLSEETADDLARLTCKRCFIVDPIDGTRVYLSGREDWTVAVAIVEDGRPVVGVVYNPCRNELFSAIAGCGATCNDQALSATPAKDLTDTTLVAPHRVIKQLKTADTPFREATYIGSLAYRIAKVSDASADVMCATRSPSDWDLAAADLVLQEAGGLLSDLSGATLLYNKPETRHPPLVGTSATLSPAACHVLAPLLNPGS